VEVVVAVAAFALLTSASFSAAGDEFDCGREKKGLVSWLLIDWFAFRCLIGMRCCLREQESTRDLVSRVQLWAREEDERLTRHYFAAADDL